MKKIQTLVLLFFFLIQLPAQVPSQAMSLQDCIKHALNNNTKVVKANLEVQKTAYVIQEQKSAGLPQVQLSAHVQYFPNIPSNIITGEFEPGTKKSLPFQFGSDFNVATGLEFKQLVYQKGSGQAKDVFSKLQQVNQLLLSKTQADLVFEVATLYYQAQVVEKKKDLLLANIAQLHGLLTLVEKQYQNGFAKKIEVDQLRVKKMDLENRLINLDLQLDQLLQVLKYQMMIPLDTRIQLTDTISEKKYELPTLPLQQPDYSTRTELSLLNRQEEINAIKLVNLKAEGFPTVFVNGAYNFQGLANSLNEFGEEGHWFNYGFIGLQLKQTLFNGFRKKAQIAQVEIENQQLKQEHRFVSQSLKLQYNQALLKLQVHLNNLQAVAETRVVAEEVYRVAQKRFTEGVGAITEVLSAEATMRETQSNYLTTLLQLKLADLEIQYARGELYTNLTSPIN